MNKIAINGRAGSGKDAVSDYLVRKYGFTKLSFAEGIYDISYRYFGMTVKDRRLLQSVGEKMREISSNVWIYYTLNRAKDCDRVVISDLRQKNEYEAVVRNGYFPIRISSDLDKRIERVRDRDGIEPNIEDWVVEGVETGADNFQYFEIENNGTLEELYVKIDKLMEDK